MLGRKSEKKLLYTFRPSIIAILLHFKIFLAAFIIPFVIIITAKEYSNLALPVSGVMGLVFGGKALHYGLDMCFSKCSLYTNQLEYRTGWIKITRRVLKYENMVDVSYTQNVHDRILHFGTILITTKGMERKLEMKMIGSPYKRYQILKKIVELSKNNPAALDNYANKNGPINDIRQ